MLVKRPTGRPLMLQVGFSPRARYEVVETRASTFVCDGRLAVAALGAVHCTAVV